MKGINISCSSHASTAIYTPIAMDQPSSSSSPSSLCPVTLLGGSSGGGGGSRAIDRHNPIIADERRISRATPPSSSHSTPFFTPKTSPFINHQKKPPKKTKKNTSITSSTNNAKWLIGLSPRNKINGDPHHHHRHHDQIHALKKGESQPSDLITVKGASKAVVDHISPPESSRYLLDDPGEEFGSGFLDRVLSDLDPVLKLKIPLDEPKISSSARHDELVVEPKPLDGSCKTSKSTKPPPPTSNSSSDHQVVVLRVSLHCRGCEGKVRKHISRMQGVRSFNVDFAAKKVTVEGDVTPLEVLARISKVKNAQIWTPPASASKSTDPITDQIFQG